MNELADGLQALTMYAMAGIYRLVAWLRGVGALEYASRVLFEGQEHYFIARAYTVLSLSVLALLVFASVRRQSGTAPALFSCSLLAFPIGLECEDVPFTYGAPLVELELGAP